MWIPGNMAWHQKRDAMCANWIFLTGELARMHDMREHSPYTHHNTVAWAMNNVERSVYISTRHMCLLYGEDTMDLTTTSKVILHKA